MAGTPGPFDLNPFALGGLTQMMQHMETASRAWTGLNVPSAMLPTVDIGELDKRIADLKAIEQWLNLNVNMLRGTIQGLEIQRGTLAAVKAFTEASSGAPRAAEPRKAPAAKPPEAAASSPNAGGAASPAVDAMAWWNMLQGSFNQVAQAAMAGAAMSDPSSRKAADTTAQNGDKSSSRSKPRSQT